MKTSFPFENFNDGRGLVPTSEKVWQFMRDYQKEHGRPPTLDEISGSHGSLNWRSSARHTVKQLVADGWVLAEGDDGTARRYKAVEPGKQLPSLGLKSVTRIALPEGW